ncbi:MAG: DUF3108 domain-containing protein [Bacillota bacterium]
MKPLRIALPALLACTLSLAAAQPAAPPAPKHKFNLPPSAELSYAITALQSGIQLGGSAQVHWVVNGKKFSVASEARAMLLGKILESRSEGAVDEYGLAPASFTEKRIRRDRTTTTFDREAGTISFTASELTYPLHGGEQDRNSAIWQLISVARAAPAKFKPGTEWTFFVAGQRDAEPWTFKVVEREKIGTPLGELNALHVQKEPAPGSGGQHVDIWLSPQHEWYPVRLRYTEADGDYIEQALDKISKGAS